MLFFLRVLSKVISVCDAKKTQKLTKKYISISLTLNLPESDYQKPYKLQSCQKS